MRILHIDTGRELRGGQRQALLLVKALREAGHESLLLCRADSPVRAEAMSSNVPVHDATLGQVRRASGWGDLVHAHDARGHTLAAIAARKPLVVSRRVGFPIQKSVFSRWKYGRPARYLAVSEFVKTQLIDAGISPERVDVVYDAISPIETLSPWRPDGPVIASKTDDPQKGADLVAQSCALAGVPVRFSTDLAADLKNAAAFLYLSRSEGLGSAALLAMGMGVPVIASRVGGLPEALGDGDAGFLVENDPEEIAAAIRSVLSDADTTLQVIKNARERVERCFSVADLLNRTLAAYRRVLLESA